MPTPVNTLWCPNKSPNINLSAGIFFVLKPRNLSTVPSLSAGCPAMLTVPTLSLLFVLNKNSLPSEMIYVLKFFSNSAQTASTSLPSLGPFSWITLTICCPLPAQIRKALSAWSFPGPSHVRHPMPSHQELPMFLGRLSSVSWRGLHCVRWEEQEVPMRSPTPAQQPVPRY